MAKITYVHPDGTSSVVDVEPGAGSGVDHAVVGHDDQPDLLGQRLAQLDGLGVDRRELLEPLRRVDAVAVAGPVEVAVVAVGEGRRDGRGLRHRHYSLPDPVGADERRSPRSGLGQSAPAELALVHHRHGHPGTGQGPERRRLGLPLARIDLVVPHQCVEQPVGPRDA